MAGVTFALWLVIAAVAWWQGGPAWAVLPAFFAGYWLSQQARGDVEDIVILERDAIDGYLVVTGVRAAVHSPSGRSYLTLARDDEGRIIRRRVTQHECDARRTHKEVVAELA